MKRIGMMLLFLASALPGFTACGADDPVPAASVPEPPAPEPESGVRLRIAVGNASFAATLADNAGARAFAALLPMTVTMDELNGNEKFYYLPAPLPAAASNPGTIGAGDLMLYGSDCLVLFYQTFPTSYAYTRLGWLDNPTGLASALGPGRATVTFERVP